MLVLISVVRRRRSRRFRLVLLLGGNRRLRLFPLLRKVSLCRFVLRRRISRSARV